MVELTRRKFLHAVTGAAVSSTVASHDAFLDDRPLAALTTISGQSGAPRNAAATPLQSLIFPEPQEIASSGSDLVLDNQVPVVVPANASKEDLLLAESLVHELSDRFGLHLKIERATSLNTNKRAILMGSIENPLVRQYCTEMKMMAGVQELGQEGYVLHVDAYIAVVCGNSDRGAFYGFQSLRQLIVNEEDQLRFRGA